MKQTNKLVCVHTVTVSVSVSVTETQWEVSWFWFLALWPWLFLSLSPSYTPDHYDNYNRHLNDRPESSHYRDRSCDRPRDLAPYYQRTSPYSSRASRQQRRPRVLKHHRQGERQRGRHGDSSLCSRVSSPCGYHCLLCVCVCVCAMEI